MTCAACWQCGQECSYALHWLCICLPSSAAPTPQSAEPRPQCTVHGAGGCHRGQGCQQSCGLQRTVMQGGYATTHLVPTYVYTHHTHINTDTYIPLHTSIQAQYTCAVIMTLLGPLHTHICTYVHVVQRALQCCTNPCNGS